MMNVSSAIEWHGVDTIIVAAGVSALQPLMAVAGIEARGTTFTSTQASKEGIQKALDAATAATEGNYLGPLVAATTLVRLAFPLSSDVKNRSLFLISRDYPVLLFSIPRSHVLR